MVEIFFSRKFVLYLKGTECIGMPNLPNLPNSANLANCLLTNV